METNNSDIQYHLDLYREGVKDCAGLNHAKRILMMRGYTTERFYALIARGKEIGCIYDKKSGKFHASQPAVV